MFRQTNRGSSACCRSDAAAACPSHPHHNWSNCGRRWCRHRCGGACPLESQRLRRPRPGHVSPSLLLAKVLAARTLRVRRRAHVCECLRDVVGGASLGATIGAYGDGHRQDIAMALAQRTEEENTSQGRGPHLDSRLCGRRRRARSRMRTRVLGSWKLSKVIFGPIEQLIFFEVFWV